MSKETDSELIKKIEDMKRMPELGIRERITLAEAVHEITNLQDQLTAARRAADCMAALERLVAGINKIVIDGPMFSDEFTIHRSNGNNNGPIGNGPDLLSAIEAARSQGE